jgi:single-stranded-DNA-specific exonuclease
VGVALKLVQALGGRFGKPHLWQDFADLAALGTVAILCQCAQRTGRLSPLALLA